MRFVAMSLSILMLSPVVMARSASANEPASEATPAQTTTSHSAPKSTASSSAHAAKAEELTAAERDLLSRGYKLRLVDGQKRFCRKETVLGSNLERTVCTTAAQVAESRQTGRDITEQIQRNQVNPNGH